MGGALVAVGFLAWLCEPQEGPVPAIDSIVIVPAKICYAAFRFAARLAVGKTRRNNMRLANRFWLKQVSPSLHFVKWINVVVFGRPGTSLIKVRVPKYGYQYFCRIDRGDFTPGREDDMVELFTPAKGDVVIDVGAHIGRYTITSSRRVGSTGKVVAIEADRGTYEILKHNIGLNALTNVIALNCAAYSAQAMLRLYQPDDNFSIYDTVMPSRADTSGKYTEVEARTLDSILDANGLQAADWIKIDVEGAEYEVLKGMTGILATNHDTTILIEIHDIQDSGHYGKIAKFLEDFGFGIEFEKSYGAGSRERHVIFRKKALIHPALGNPSVHEQHKPFEEVL
ncbi:MAG: FkbM family methyltransferase [Nitrososphaera sp.]|jgi:FkbM family methyltransferase